MSALTKLRDQIAIARELGHMIVLTADEAQAIVDEVMRVSSPLTAPLPRSLVQTPLSAPPHEGDDEHAH